MAGFEGLPWPKGRLCQTSPKSPLVTPKSETRSEISVKFGIYKVKVEKKSCLLFTSPILYGAPLALKQGLDFSKAPLRGAVFLLPWVRAKKSSPEGEKMGSNPGSNPIFAHFRLIFHAILLEGLSQI